MNFQLLIDKCKQNGINDVEIYSVHTSGESVSLFNLDIDDNTVDDLNCYSIRAIIDNKNVSTYVENITEDHFDTVVNHLLTQAKYLQNTDSQELYEDKNIVDIKENLENDFDTYSKDKQIKYLQDLVKKVKDYSNLVTTVQAELSFKELSKSLVNTKGLNKNYSKKVGRIVLEVVVKKDNDTRSSFAYQSFNNVSEIDINKLLNDSVVDAINSLGAKSIKTDSYKVVISNKCMITLLSAYSMHFSASNVIKKMSNFSDKLNTKVFGSNVTIVDDPNKNEFNHQPFDDEGVKTYSKEIVSNGVLKTFMHNRTTASLLNTTTTGNGFKASMQSSLEVSPCNLYLKEGSKELDEVFKDMFNGVYITGFDGAHAGINAVSGNFNLKASGYLVENGKISKPLTLIILSGNFFDMMNDINEIASDLDFRSNIGSASVYVNKMNISGK